IQPLLSTEPHNIPLDERFYLGGDETIRGFRPYKPGPKFEDSKDPRGGISLQYLSLEYNRPLMKRVEAFVYLDMGQLSLQRWHFGRLNIATGVGLKLSLFPGMPPLVLGWGIPLNAKHRSDVKQFFLSLGGHF